MHKKMKTGVDDMPDDILCNIFARLPVKPMAGRCRCVSKRWNALISDPNFMMSRSSPLMIFFENCKDDYIYKLDESRESVTDLDLSIFNLPPLVYNSHRRDRRSVTIGGTFSGIILLVVTYHTENYYPSYTTYNKSHMILYNPTTGVYDILDDDPYPPLCDESYAYGFGYGATVDELKIVRFRTYRFKKKRNTCDVFNLKTRLWSHPQVLIIQDAMFQEVIGTFLKGYLYWIISKVKKGNRYSKIVAFDVDKMVFSEMHLPDRTINDKYNHLGTCHGCLWTITSTAVTTLNFYVWVMNINDQGVDDNYSWSKTCSLTIGLEGRHHLYLYKIIEITDDRRFIISVIMDDCPYLIIYDTSKHSYKLLDFDLEELPNRGIKYKESLVSPKNICRASLK